MSEMSLDEQIRRLKEMKSYLGDFCKLMRQEMQTLYNDMKFLRSQGLSVETEESYNNRYYNPANDDVEQVVSDIYGPHFNYLDEVIEKLERARNR